MARQVLPVVGALVGGFFGGAAGAQWGWAIGSVVGNAIDPLVIKGPSIGDIAQQSSQEGVPRPIVFAISPPMAGNIIATSEPRIVRRKKSQGKGGPKVETESVFRTYAIGVCEGIITQFLRVWRNGTLVFDISDNRMLPLSESFAFLQRARFFTGDFTQNPSPDLEAIFGVGITPAHRGTAYMVMADDDLTDFRGAIPQYTFQVQRCGTLNMLEGAPTPISLTSAGYTFAVQLTWTQDIVPYDYANVINFDTSAIVATGVTNFHYLHSIANTDDDPPITYIIRLYTDDGAQVGQSNLLRVTFDNIIVVQADSSDIYIGYMEQEVREVVQAVAAPLGFLAFATIQTGIIAFYRQQSPNQYVMIRSTMVVFDHIKFIPTGGIGTLRLDFSDASLIAIGPYQALTWPTPVGLDMLDDSLFAIEVIF